MAHAFRRLFKSAGFTLTAIITLGAAIGANALIFSVVNGVLLKPLPFAEPERLVGVWHVAPGVMPGPLQQSAGTYLMYREAGQVFQDIGLWSTGSVSVTGRGDPEQVDSLTVTDGTLGILGVRPALGRAFTAEDDSPTGPDTVIISHRYWQRVFNGQASAVGQSLTVNGRAREVIGVLPADFRFLRYDPSILQPFRFNRTGMNALGFSYQGLARLKPGVTIEQANADVARLLPTLVNRFPLPPGFTQKMFDEAKLGPLVRPLDVDVVGDIGPMLWILLGTVGLVLLVACANVANLFLVRAESRQQELAVRLALGAGHARVVWQLLSEALLLAVLGGVLGAALAYGGIRLLQFLQPARLPRLNEIGLDPIVVLFTLGLSLAAGLLFGLIPALKYARPQVAGALKDSARGSSDGRERHRARNGLVAAQVALAVVLLVGSGLMVRTFLAMRDVPPGFQNARDVLTFRLSIPQAAVADGAQVARLHEQLAGAVAAVGGVQSVALTTSLPMEGNNNNDPIFVEDFPNTDGKLPPIRRFKFLVPGYFATMGNTLVAGRDFTWSDIHTLAPVVIVSENLAREYWKDPVKAVGRRIRPSPQGPWREIIGVAGAERQDGVTAAAPAIAYWPMLMNDFWGNETFVQRSMAYAVRTSRLGNTDFLTDVQRAIWAINPNLPLARVRTLDEIYQDSMAQTSFALVILGIAAGVTLLLGVVGIYGVIAYVVAQRRREVGIRMALGADGGDVQRLFVARGLVPTAAGLAAGVVASALVMRVVTAMLFGVSPFDLVTYGSVVIGLGLIALIATWLPARRATIVDPALALRSE